MNKLNIKIKNKIYLLISFLVILLCVLLFIEFKWFDNIAKNEFYKTYTSLFMNTNRVATREFDRLPMYNNWIKKTINETMKKEELEKYLSATYKNSDLSILDNKVIDSIGYINMDTNNLSIYDGNSWKFESLNNEYLDKITIIDEKIIIDDNENLTLFISNSQTRIIIININLIKFFEIYIIPAIEENNSDIFINWCSQTNNLIINEKNYKEFKKFEEYSFNPLKYIFSNEIHNNNSITIPIVKQEINKNFSRVKPIFQINAEISQENINNNQIPTNDLLDIESSNVLSYLNIYISEDNFFGFYIEKTLSFIFIGGLILISLIGFICILLIYQLIIIKKQQKKEREFTSSITHELRTPITVIQSASDNLSDNLIKKERIPTYGKLIKQQTTRLNNMIENLLVFSKIENNKGYRINEVPTNLNTLINDIKRHFIPITKENHIKIEWTTLNLNNTVLIDKSLIELILSNLINNSIFHAYNNQSGEIRVFIKYSKQNNKLSCIIEDDGIGISIKDQKNIWDSYYRGKKSIQSQERGSGLGLFIVKRNISILGGKITLSSPYKRLNGQIKNGCQFNFYINCKDIKNEKNINN